MQGIEALVASKSAVAWVCYGDELASLLRESIGYRFEIRGAVKSMVLDWAVDLETAGILGEGLGFSISEKLEAASVTQHIYAQNIGTFGNVDGRSSVTNLFVGSGLTCDLITNCAEKIKTALPALPKPQQTAINAELQKIEQTGYRDESLSRDALRSIKAICEGVAVTWRPRE